MKELQEILAFHKQMIGDCTNVSTTADNVFIFTTWIAYIGRLFATCIIKN